jgi:hypothetical protein
MNERLTAIMSSKWTERGRKPGLREAVRAIKLLSWRFDTKSVINRWNEPLTP